MPTIYSHQKPNFRLYSFARCRMDEIDKQIEQLQLERGLMEIVAADCKAKVCPDCCGEGTVMKPIPGCECDGPRQHTCERCAGTGGVRASEPPKDSYPDQTVRHDERNVGNCLQATIAGVLGWPIGTVPHFALLGEEHWWDCAQAWLSAQGYWIDYKPDNFTKEGGALMPRCWLSGKTVRGTQHAVVGDSATGQMLHDPHPSRAGLVAVDYTVYFFRKPREVDAGRALHTGTIAALSRLMDGDPAPGTPHGDGLSLLADAIANYERATVGVKPSDEDQPK